MYLKECVESILNQTYSKIEVVIVDDGSTDNSLAICKEYRDKDKRVRIFHKENSGVSSARNLGLRMAEGDYISFCDSDDVVKPELYWTLLQNLKIQERTEYAEDTNIYIRTIIDYIASLVKMMGYTSVLI